MGGTFRRPSEKKFVWRLHVGQKTAQRLLSDENTEGDLTFNNMELVAYVMHLYILAPLMAPLEHIPTTADNAAT